jgi:hypothetical protein
MENFAPYLKKGDLKVEKNPEVAEFSQQSRKLKVTDITDESAPSLFCQILKYRN